MQGQAWGEGLPLRDVGEIRIYLPIHPLKRVSRLCEGE